GQADDGRGPRCQPVNPIGDICPVRHGGDYKNHQSNVQYRRKPIPQKSKNHAVIKVIVFYKGNRRFGGFHILVSGNFHDTFLNRNGIIKFSYNHIFVKIKRGPYHNAYHYLSYNFKTSRKSFLIFSKYFYVIIQKTNRSQPNGSDQQ